MGFRLGRLVYYLVYHGRLDIDFPHLVYLCVANGSEFGNINHLTNFVTKFLPYLADAVRGRLEGKVGH